MLLLDGVRHTVAAYCQEVTKESSRMVGKEILAGKGLQERLGKMLCPNKNNIRQTKRKKPQKGWICVRIGRWKVKRDDTAIEKVCGSVEVKERETTDCNR